MSKKLLFFLNSQREAYEKGTKDLFDEKICVFVSSEEGTKSYFMVRKVEEASLIEIGWLGCSTEKVKKDKRTGWKM